MVLGQQLMKRKVNAMIIEYDNDKEASNTQAVALDFWSNARYAQPIIYDRMVKARTMSTPTPEEPTRHVGGPFNK
jgi:hypothetical protein